MEAAELFYGHSSHIYKPVKHQPTEDFFSQFPKQTNPDNFELSGFVFV
jgi:hypothetical protein